MNQRKRALWVASVTPLFLTPLLLLATSGGGPLRHTGAFGEPGCNESGCHRLEPLPPSTGGRITIDVGPYVPGQKQRVRITIIDAGASAWGFQLAAREVRNPQRQAGTFSTAPDDLFVTVRCPTGNQPPPCTNDLEYVTHTSVGTRLGTRSGSVTFFVDWTAPAADVGNIIFTAAGVGADGDRGTDGDKSYTATAVSLFAPSNQPVLNQGGVVNAAGAPNPSAGISPGTLVSLYGQRFAPPGFTREVTRDDLQEGRLPIELARAGADFFLLNRDPVPAYVVFVSEKQMNVQVPALPLGLAPQVDVQPVFNRGQGSNEVRGNRVTVNLGRVSPGLFTFPSSNSAAAITPSGAPVGRVGQFPNSRPARPGDIIMVFGTGFGTTNPAVDPGALAPGGPASLAGVSARIGSVFLASTDILYAGAAPGFAGLQQFNLRVPAGVGSGDLPIALGVSGLESQAGVILAVEP